MPRGRPKREIEVSRVRKKGPKDLEMRIQITAPWGDDLVCISMKNPVGNIPRPKQNQRSFIKAILDGLHREFGGQFESH